MKYLKKALIVFIPVFMSLFLLKGYIATNDFSKRLVTILNSSGLNIEAGEISLKGFNKLKIDNLKVKDMQGNVVIDAKEATANINLLMPSRLLRVDVYGATVNLERRQDNYFNIFDVMKSEEKKNPPRDRSSRIGKLYIHDAILNYTDVSFNQKISKTLKHVNGYLETSKSRGFALEAKGEGDILVKDSSGNLSVVSSTDSTSDSSTDSTTGLTGASPDSTTGASEKLKETLTLKEKLGIKLFNRVDNIQSLKSMFDMKKNDDESRQSYEISFLFENINVNEQLAQYVPMEDLIKAKKGLLNGILTLDNKNSEKNTQVTGNLKVQNGTLNYVDFDGDIEKIDAEINLTREKVTVEGNTKVKSTENKEGLINLNLIYDLINQKLSLGLKTADVPYEEIARYKLLKEFNVKAKGNITGNLNVNYSQQEKETTLDGKFSSDNINIGGYNFQNIKTDMTISKDQILTLNNTSLHFDNSISDFRIKADADMKKFTYDINKKEGKADYIIKNRALGENGKNGNSDFSIKTVTGDFNINKENIISGTFNSKEIDGTYKFDIPEQLLTVNAKGKENFTVKYANNSYAVNPTVENLVLNLRKQNIMQSGTINAKLTLLNNKMLGPIDAKVDIHNGNYNVDALINVSGQYVKAKGVTTSDMAHSYTVSTVSTAGKAMFDAVKLLRAAGYNDIKGISTAKLPVTLTANITGKGNNISGDYEVYSPYGQFIVEYEELHAKGKIKDLLSLNLDVNARMEELWLGYQRLKNVEGVLDLKNNILNIIDVHNEKLKAAGTYNIKTGHMNINSNLNNYIVYNTIVPEVNVLLNKVNVNMEGSIDNLNGSITVTPSNTYVNRSYIGTLIGNVDVKNSVLDFQNVVLRENQLSGTYDLKTGLADMILSLDEPDIPKLLETKDLTFGTKSELKLQGDLNDFDLTGQIELNNMSYKGYKLPSVVTDIAYLNGDVDKMFGYGLFDIKRLSLIGDEGEEIFRTNTSFDLANIDVDYKLENQIFSLDSVKDLKEKGYSGNIDLNFILKGKPDDFFTDIKVKSDNIILSGFPVENLDIDVQANNQELNVGQFYLEYENNPLLVNGFVQFSPMVYNMSLVAQDFNLGFLGLNDTVDEAGGIANINIVFANDETQGIIKLDNFSYITKDKVTRAENINADINVVDRKLNVNRLDGGYNGGTFTVSGDLDVPSVPEDFMKTKRLELGKFELVTALNNVGVKYGEDIDLSLTGDIRFTENRLFGNLIVNSGEIRAIPSFASNTKVLSEEEEAKKNQDKTIVEGVVEEVVDKIVNQYNVDVNIQVNDGLELNIPNVSLVKNIRGKITGASRVMYDSGELSLLGNYSIKRGNFMLNGNKFNIETAEVRFTNADETLSNMNPFVNFEATSTINSERISVGMNGYLNNSNITLQSDSGLSREQILSLLAFNTSIGDTKNENGEVTSTKTNSEANAAILGSVVNTALNELLFSSITGKIGETFGLTNISINTGLSDSTSSNGTSSSSYSGATTLTIQDNIYKNKWFWNLQVKFPFGEKENKTSNNSSTTSNDSNPLGYNFWINYDLVNGFGLKAGGETLKIKDTDNYATGANNKTKINYYFGVDFSAKSDSFGDLMRKMFKKKKLETLTKTN